MDFQIGEKVVYPNQGVCVIQELCERSIAGRKEEFFVLEILANNSTVMIPVSNVDRVGLRRLCDEQDLESLFSILGSDSYQADPDWKNRYKENIEKMKSGSIFEVGMVLQNLHFLGFQKPLSFREKKMYERARQLVVSEVAMVRSQELPSAEATVETILNDAYQELHAGAPA